MSLKFTLLGCGYSMGVPRIDGQWGNCNPSNIKNFRTRCSAFIKKKSFSILIDTSPDLKKQLLSNKIKNITHVLYTHKHADQTHGINELRPFFWKNKKRIDAYGNKETIRYLKESFNYCFNKVDHYKPMLKPNIIKSHFSLLNKRDKISFKAIKIKHGKIYSLGYIFQKIAYLSDCSSLSKKNLKDLLNLKYLFIDCLRFTPHPTHLNLQQALEVVKILRPKKTFLINLHSDLDFGILMKILPKNVRPGYDGLTVEI